MKKYIDSLRVATAVRMARSVHEGAFLLVEGGSDKRFFENMVHHSARAVVACTKDNVLGALEILLKDRFPGLLAIVDADYWVLEGRQVAGALITDSHDLETMILASPALNKIVGELIGGEPQAATLDLVAQLREALLSSGVPIGCLRWASERHKLGLNFKFVDPWQFVDSRDFSVHLDALIRNVCESPAAVADPNIAGLRARVLTLWASKEDPWMVCQGHDLLRLLAMALPLLLDRWGTSAAAERARSATAMLDDKLFAAYEPGFFRKTRLYAAIREWETHNPKYAVLARDE
jgi:hypothetical protein